MSTNTAGVRKRRRGWIKPLSTLLIVIYAPYGWLLFKELPWSSHHWGWIKGWPGLPAMGLRARFWTDLEFEAELGLMYLSTAILLVALVAIARRSRRALWVTGCATLLFSLLNSGYCRALYLM